MQPTHLTTTENRELVIQWSDGVKQTIPFRLLRDQCQCATCNEARTNPPPPREKSALPVLTAAEARPLEIEKMHPAGNYAYSVHFSDGHSLGIYTFEMLRRIGDMALQSE